MATMTANRFQPTTQSFGELTLHHAPARRTLSLGRIDVRRHYQLILGWAFAVVFLAGLGTLYALDHAAFAGNDQPSVAYAGVMLDQD